ncbi:MAG TPA: aldo/keto reductase [Methylomirabilota bacterium]|nr:aldo/keto reductase [Methylomirabilota bacterium]
MISGWATPEGTGRYRVRLGSKAAEGHFRAWQGLECSSLGIGTYLGEEDAATDRAYQEAVGRAMALGINVIDSAINYRHQRSERSVGAALAAAVSGGTLQRDEVLLATKGGFIPFDGAVPADPRGYLVETYVRSGLLTPADVVGGSHCMAPRYLADQLERSRRNLGVETVDVYYVHNPEMQLSEVDRPTFLARLRSAFEFLEGAVAGGKIRFYGTATWTGYRQPPTAPDYLSLEEVVGVARDLAGDAHHMRVIQLPYNLAMTEAATGANQKAGAQVVSVLQAAQRMGMYVMTSASILQGRLARNLPPALAQVLTGLETDAQRALQFVRSSPGVGTALCGMKSAAHVEENARLVGVPPVPPAQLFTQG